MYVLAVITALFIFRQHLGESASICSLLNIETIGVGGLKFREVAVEIETRKVAFETVDLDILDFLTFKMKLKNEELSQLYNFSDLDFRSTHC